MLRMKKILIVAASLAVIVLISFVALGLPGGGENEYYDDENGCDEQYQPEPYAQTPQAHIELPAQAAPPDIYEEEPAVAPPDDYIYEDPPYTPEVLGSPSPTEQATPLEIYCGEVAIPPMSDEERAALEAALEERLRENLPVGFIPRILEDGSMIRLSPDDGSLEILAPDGTRTPLYGATITPDGSIIRPE